MQIYNSFNALAAAQGQQQLVSDMSVFNVKGDIFGDVVFLESKLREAIRSHETDTLKDSPRILEKLKAFEEEVGNLKAMGYKYASFVQRVNDIFDRINEDPDNRYFRLHGLKRDA